MKKYTDEKRNVKVHNFKIGDIVYVANVEPGKLDSSYSVTKYVIIDVILGDLLQSVFSVVSAPDNIVQSKLVSLTK